MAYHYTDSGLDSIYLENGVHVEETPYGQAVSIEDSAGLHRAIAQWLIKRPSPLNGAELRFLRLEMEMTQRDLAGVIGAQEQTLRLWEKGRGKHMPGPPDRLVRALCAEAFGGDDKIRDMLQRLADLDRLAHDDACFKHNRKGWKPSVSPCLHTGYEKTEASPVSA